MVLSLVDLSLRTVTKGVENGTIRHPHLLSPMLREWVLDMAIKEGLTDHPNGMELLTSVDFLTGMTSLNVKACNGNDLRFLQRLIASLATKLPDGQTVGAAITKLNLKVFEYGADGSDFKTVKTYCDVISKVYDLIGQCPNTASMESHVFKMGAGYWPLNENGNSACNRVMENLIKLSVVLCGIGFWAIIDSERPIINFKQLTTLKLEYCSFDDGTWPKLLEKIPLVENLHLSDVRFWNKNGLDCILPFSLPHLKSLEVLGRLVSFECNIAFVDKLMKCKQLRQLHLKLDETSTDEESLVRLATMDIDLKMQVRHVVSGNDAATFDSSSRCKLVRIFHERIESFEFEVWQKWNAQFSVVLEDVVNSCSSLTSFGFKHPDFDVISQPQIDPVQEMKQINAALVRFFNTPQCAQQLEGLRLQENFDETVLSAVFESCPNLVRLSIYHCSNLRDQHLIDWVSRGGGKLTHLFVVGCENVTSEGIIPILAKSAEGLLRCNWSSLGQDNGGRNWETVLRNHCPNAVNGKYPLLSIP